MNAPKLINTLKIAGIISLWVLLCVALVATLARVKIESRDGYTKSELYGYKQVDQ